MSRDTRAHLIDVAAGLLAHGGPGAVTTRSVAEAAGTQAPTIYRLFGDKVGLLAAVVVHAFSTYAEGKQIDPGLDPVTELRRGWDLHIGFGLANPEVFRLAHVALRSPDGQAAMRAGLDVLEERVRRVALAGRLRVSERRAVELIHATGTGIVLTMINEPRDDDGLAEAGWESVAAVILTGDAAAADGPMAAAVTLRAALPALELSPGERGLLAEWLQRISGAAAVR